MKIPKLKIGDLVLDLPIIQGGMGVKVSGASLASAVANLGAVGVIASVGLALERSSSKEEDARAVFAEIKKARTLTKGVLGVNIMVALSNYEDHVRAGVEAGVDLIISGAGLPLKLPQYVGDSKVKLLPIVSSAKAARIICEYWHRKYQRIPDAMVVEGPLAGGHLGFSFKEIAHPERFLLERLTKEVIEVIKPYEREYGQKIPVIAAGGIYTGEDIARFLKIGAAGVQMGTRFVATEECDVDIRFKQAYLKAKKEDVVIIRSPVGMPGRVIRNRFVEEVERGEKKPFRCDYRCLIPCEPKKVPYCIAYALLNAQKGDLDNGFAFAGANVWRVDRIVPVKGLMEELIKELSLSLKDIS